MNLQQQNQGQSSREGYIKSLGRTYDRDLDQMNDHARKAYDKTKSYFKEGLLDRIQRATSNSNMTWDQRGQAVKEEYDARTKTLERLRQQVERKKNKWD